MNKCGSSVLVDNCEDTYIGRDDTNIIITGMITNDKDYYPSASDRIARDDVAKAL